MKTRYRPSALITSQRQLVGALKFYSKAAKPKTCRCQPPHEADVHRFAREYAADQIQNGEAVSYEKALAETRKYLASGGRLPAHYAMERRISQLDADMADGAVRRASGAVAKERFTNIMKYAAEHPEASYAEACRKLGY